MRLLLLGQTTTTIGLGSGPTVTKDLNDCDDLEFEPQGGMHVWVCVRLTGVHPGDPDHLCLG